MEEFRGLSSSSQNAQLYKILSAIHDEIGKLKASTDARFTYLENLVHQQQRRAQQQQQVLNSIDILLTINQNLNLYLYCPLYRVVLLLAD